MSYRIGFDIGSTTIKAVVMNENGEILYKSYERHKAQIREMALAKIEELKDLLGDEPFYFALSGSAALGMSQEGDLPFVQEVFASAQAVRKHYPHVDAAIELGGEDAKILFFQGAIEQRMNSTCAGGTGAFIDQMASLLNLDLAQMDELSLQYQRLYPIASRCGVFAKSDVQPLINQGVDKADLCASIFQAVVDQTITSLAQGRKIEGNVLFLGGPLFFLKGLRQRFMETLKLDDAHAQCPEIAIHFVAFGSALCASERFTYEELHRKLEALKNMPVKEEESEPLFVSEEEYEAFVERHKRSDVRYGDLSAYQGKVYLGVDSGSTTTKLVLIGEDQQLLYEAYTSNQGSPLDVVLEHLKKIYEQGGDRIEMAGSCATGYGEELMRHAFHLDEGSVETMAHYEAAKYFNPDVDYILDIGGQDIKCFQIRDGRIDDIVLNEACSSGCGSFIETFAKSLGYSAPEFAQLGLKAQHPVNLGTRCTVFMNSGVKQAQKNGATIEDISAGLCRSVVKNALYKVIRAKRKEDLGTHIVVQGGTFRNDSVLRSFEQELGMPVIRPSIAHLMGAYGAALIARRHSRGTSSTLIAQELETFSHTSKGIVCNGCTNHCSLTVNIFSDGERLIAGNKCEKPVLRTKPKEELPDLYKVKNDLLNSYRGKYHHETKIGIPFVLNIYDLLPFWSEFFHQLGYEVLLSPPTSKPMYHQAQHSIPSDTACLPAKVVHGHIQWLLDQKVERIFYPCMTYNVDEKISDNHFNCPLVAYYPETIGGNMELGDVDYMHPYIVLDDLKVFEKRISAYFKEHGLVHERSRIRAAIDAGMKEYRHFHEELHQAHEEALAYARAHHHPIAVLCGRPYHGDPFISHQISQLLTQLGFVVVSEESIPLQEKKDVNVLNQWTYHARLYQAAYYAAKQPDMELVHLVSFGCGIDAITSDEVKAILKQKDRFYTQIKIDEIDNLGAVKIRLRSLKAAIEDREGGQ